MKKSLVIALALMLVLAFASSAMAAQAFAPIGDAVYATGERVVLPTVVELNEDGISNYPYEIYLPNELNPDQYRIHSSYAKDTDACASCHSVHTGMNDMLLQWYTIYDTCMACHDGTISTTYDVVRGVTGNDLLVDGNTKNVAAPGGMFGLGNEESLSSHNVTESMSNAAAPGGGTVEDEKGLWESAFGCAECHEPHGAGGNARLLKGDVNGAATALATEFKFNANPTLDTAAGMVPNVEGTLAAAITKNGITGATVLTGTYFAVKPDSLDDAWVYNGNKDYKLTDVPPYLFSTSLKVYQGSGLSWTLKTNGVDYDLDNTLGYTRVIWRGTAPAASAIKFAGVPQFKVVMKINNYLNQGGMAEKVYHISGLNPFCGGCHTDYNTASYEVYNQNVAASSTGAAGLNGRRDNNGAYSKAHRHTVARSGTTTGYATLPGLGDGVEYPFINLTGSYTTTNLSCLGCHVAHGAGQSWWNNYLVDRDIAGPSGDLWTTAETKEISGSSALKRMPNMGVCMYCHKWQADQVGYAANSGLTAPTIDDETADFQTWNVAGLTDTTKGLGFAGFQSLNSGYDTSSYFLRADGQGFFKSGIKYVGAEACENCHKEYYDGWAEGGHSESFQTPDQVPVIDAYKKVGTYDIALPVGVTKLDVWNKGIGQSGATDIGDVTKFTWSVDSNNVASYVYYSIAYTGADGVSGNVYLIGDNTHKAYVDLDDVKYIWMNHYVLSNQSITEGAGTDGVNVTLKTGALLRGINLAGSHLEPYLNRVAAGYEAYLVPAMPSAATWYGGSGSSPDLTKPAQGCISCHAPQLNVPVTAGTPDVTISCETCHGPGELHVGAPSTNNIFSTKTQLPGDANFAAATRACLNCHAGYHEQLGSPTGDNFLTSAHYSEYVGCNSCHEVHNAAENGHDSLKVTPNLLCSSCHGYAIDTDAYMDKENLPNGLTNHAFKKDTAGFKID